MKALIILATTVALFSCKKSDPVPVQNTTTCDPQVSYLNTVKPIFVANCTASGCHDGGDLPSLSEYQVARDASQQIKTAVKNGIMPKNGILSDSVKATIICWIDSGSKNN